MQPSNRQSLKVPPSSEILMPLNCCPIAIMAVSVVSLLPFHGRRVLSLWRGMSEPGASLIAPVPAPGPDGGRLVYIAVRRRHSADAAIRLTWDPWDHEPDTEGVGTIMAG